MDVGTLWAAAVASPVVVPAVATLVASVVVAWLNSRGTFRKQQSEEALALAARQDKYRDELRSDLVGLRARFERSEEIRLKLAEERLRDREERMRLEAEVRDLRGLVATLQRMAGDRRHDPLAPGPDVLGVLEVKPPAGEGS